LAVAGASGYVLAGCGDDDSGGGTSATKAAGGSSSPSGSSTQAQATATEAVKTGGTLRQREANAAQQWDPVSATSPTQRQLGPAYNSVIQFDPLSPDPKLVADLAESWETTENGLVWNFKLRQGVTFHDGSPFTSEDVAANIQRQITPPSGIASGLQLFYKSVVDTVTTPSPDRAIVRLKIPSGLFPTLMALTKVGPKARAGSVIKDPNDVVGTGPFKVGAFEPDVSVKFVRSSNYYVKDRPYLDEVTVAFITDEDAALNAFRGGRIDLLSDDGMTPEQYDATNNQKGILIHKEPTTIWYGFSINAAAPPLTDPRVRQAIMLAIDNDAVAQGPFRNINARGGILPPGQWGLSQSDLQQIPGYGPDPKKNLDDARRLLADAGLANGFTLKHTGATSGDSKAVSLIIQSQLDQLKIKLDIDFIDGAAVVAARRAGKYVTIVGGDSYPTDDPVVVLGRAFVQGAPEPFPSYSNASVNDLYTKLLTTTDTNQRKQISNQIDKTILGDFVHKNIIWKLYTAASRDYVKNIVPIYNPYLSYHRHENTWMSAH
jgi:peptide/nickel transport system substrate-binding protein